MENNDEEVRLSDLTVINEIEMQSNTVVSTESSVTCLLYTSRCV